MEQAPEARCVGISAAGSSKERERLRHGEHVELGFQPANTGSSSCLGNSGAWILSTSQGFLGIFLVYLRAAGRSCAGFSEMLRIYTFGGGITVLWGAWVFQSAARVVLVEKAAASF